MPKSILRAAIPNGAENGLFQLVKVARSSITALFGAYQIAADGVAQSIWLLAALAGVAMRPVHITVIGQCMGNGDTDDSVLRMPNLKISAERDRPELFHRLITDVPRQTSRSLAPNERARFLPKRLCLKCIMAALQAARICCILRKTAV